MRLHLFRVLIGANLPPWMLHWLDATPITLSSAWCADQRRRGVR